MFRTELQPEPATTPFRTGQKILSIGSCFANCMGSRLQASKFQTLTNPFGVLFNPLSVARLLRKSLHGGTLTADRLVHRHGLYFHFDLHSDMVASSGEALLADAQTKLQETGRHLREADHLIITLGTALVYYHTSSEDYVANCHKVPSAHFSKRLLQPIEVEESLEGLIEDIQSLPNPPSITLTVSPVRHIKDTLPLNNVSKSVLRLAVHNLTTRHPRVRYFPSFELLTDDLRDYRFYKEDMLHPTPQAEMYIWNKFVETSFDKETQHFVKEWGKLSRALAHRPLRPGTEEHLAFLHQTLNRLDAFSSLVDTTREKERLRQQIAEYDK